MNTSTYELIFLKDNSFTRNNVYIIVNKNTNSAAIIDPACDLYQIINAISKRKISLDKIILTHSHLDHIRRVDDLIELYNCDVYISKRESNFYYYKCSNLNLFEDGEIIFIGDNDKRMFN